MSLWVQTIQIFKALLSRHLHFFSTWLRDIRPAWPDRKPDAVWIPSSYTCILSVALDEWHIMRDMVNICVMISSTTLLMIKVFAAVVALKWWILRALKPKHIHTYNMFSILHKSGVQSRQTIVKGMVTSKLHIWYVHGFSQFYIVIQSIIMLYMHVYIYIQYNIGEWPVQLWQLLTW